MKKLLLQAFVVLLPAVVFGQHVFDKPYTFLHEHIYYAPLTIQHKQPAGEMPHDPIIILAARRDGGPPVLSVGRNVYLNTQYLFCTFGHVKINFAMSLNFRIFIRFRFMKIL